MITFNFLHQPNRLGLQTTNFTVVHLFPLKKKRKINSKIECGIYSTLQTAKHEKFITNTNNGNTQTMLWLWCEHMPFVENKCMQQCCCKICKNKTTKKLKSEFFVERYLDCWHVVNIFFLFFLSSSLFFCILS